MARRKKHAFTAGLLRNKNRRLAENLLADTHFQAELQLIRSAFGIPEHPTAEEWRAFLGQHLNSLTLQDELYASPHYRAAMQQVLACCEELERKHGTRVMLIAPQLATRFDVAVQEALQRLGLRDSWRDFFLSCLAGSPTGSIIPPSYGLEQDAQTGTIRGFVLHVTPHDSDRDAVAILEQARAWDRLERKILRARPSAIQDPEKLEQFIVDYVKEQPDRRVTPGRPVARTTRSVPTSAPRGCPAAARRSSRHAAAD
jgi:hypothetical protein